MSCSVPLCLFLLRQSLSVKLELNWWPVNPRDPPVSAFTVLGLRARDMCSRTHLAFCVSAGIQTEVFMFLHQMRCPLSGLPSPNPGQTVQLGRSYSDAHACSQNLQISVLVSCRSLGQGPHWAFGAVGVQEAESTVSYSPPSPFPPEGQL